MQKLETIKNLSELSLPFYVTAARNDIIGINKNLELNIGDVRCITEVDNTGAIIIKNIPKIRSSMYSTFRLAYKNEIRLCKS